MGFFWTIVVLVILLGITWRYLGSYMAAVFERPRALLRGGPSGRSTGSSAPVPTKSRHGSVTPARW